MKTIPTWMQPYLARIACYLRRVSEWLGQRAAIQPYLARIAIYCAICSENTSFERQKKNETAMPDELRPEYDLRNLRVRKVGRGRKSFGRSVVQLANEVFPDADCERQRENEKRIPSSKI